MLLHLSMYRYSKNDSNAQITNVNNTINTTWEVIDLKTNEAIKWLKKLKTEGNKWNENNINLSPNLKCSYDDEWRNEKSNGRV